MVVGPCMAVEGDTVDWQSIRVLNHAAALLKRFCHSPVACDAMRRVVDTPTLQADIGQDEVSIKVHC